MRVFDVVLLLSFFAFSSTLPVSTTTSGSIIEIEEEEDVDSGSEEDLLDHPWSCGTDGFSMLIAEGTIDKDCPAIKNEVNNCCFNHDTCYDEQRGRDHCDDVFCECLTNVTINHKTCHDEDALVFCNLVRELGESAYNASAPQE